MVSTSVLCVHQHSECIKMVRGAAARAPTLRVHRRGAYASRRIHQYASRRVHQNSTCTSTVRAPAWELHHQVVVLQQMRSWP